MANTKTQADVSEAGKSAKKGKINTTDRVEIEIKKDYQFLKAGQKLKVHPTVKAKYKDLGII